MKRRIIHNLVLASLFLTLGLTSCGSKSGNEIRYVAIGASDATGIGADPITNGYVYRIEDGIKASTDKKVKLINLGIPGATIDIIENIELPLAKQSTADVVTIFIGGNDINKGVSVEKFSKNLRSIVLGVTTNTNAFTVIANLPDISKLPSYIEKPKADVTTAVVLAYNSEIKKIANEFGIPVVDLYSEPLAGYLISSDGFHPNNEGYDKMATKFLNIILPFLGSQTTTTK